MVRNLFTYSLLVFTFISNAQDQEKNSEQIRKSIYFGGGSYYVTEDQSVGISEFIESIENIENYSIILAGHTDNIGSREYNDWLSDMRTVAVKLELLKIAVPEDLIFLKKFGKDHPLYDNQSHLGRRANRRVDIILLPIVF